MENVWVLASMWVGLALIATLLATWFQISTALTEIVVGTVAQLIIGALVAPMTHMLTRIVKKLMLNQETPIYAIAPGFAYEELGLGSHLYWNDRQRLHVGGLSLNVAKELVEWCIRRFGLEQFDLEGFREDILDFSEMLPGAILRMCAAACASRYQFEGRIKTKLLHVDYLMKHCHGNGQTGNFLRGT